MSNPREASPRTLRLRGIIGILVVAAIVALVVINPFSSDDTSKIAVVTPSLPDGVRSGIPIDIRGETVGEVCGIDISSREQTRVELCLNSVALGELTEDAGVSFVSRSVFGSDALRLIPVTSGAKVKAGGQVTLSSPPNDYTITAAMRNAGGFTLPVLTPELTALLTQLSDATIRLSPFLTAGTVFLQTMEEGDLSGLTGRLPVAADALDGVAQAAAGGVGALQTVIGNRLLADNEYTAAVARMIADIGGLFSDLGALFNGMAGLGATMDLLTAFTTPLSGALRGTTPDQIARLVNNFGGAFHKDPRTGKMVLALDVELQTVPGVATGLAQLISGPAAGNQAAGR